MAPKNILAITFVCLLALGGLLAARTDHKIFLRLEEFSFWLGIQNHPAHQFSPPAGGPEMTAALETAQEKAWRAQNYYRRLLASHRVLNPSGTLQKQVKQSGLYAPRELSQGVGYWGAYLAANGLTETELATELNQRKQLKTLGVSDPTDQTYWLAYARAVYVGNFPAMVSDLKVFWENQKLITDHPGLNRILPQLVYPETRREYVDFLAREMVEIPRQAERRKLLEAFCVVWKQSRALVRQHLDFNEIYFYAREIGKYGSLFKFEIRMKHFFEHRNQSAYWQASMLLKRIYRETFGIYLSENPAARALYHAFLLRLQNTNRPENIIQALKATREYKAWEEQSAQQVTAARQTLRDYLAKISQQEIKDNLGQQAFQEQEESLERKLTTAAGSENFQVSHLQYLEHRWQESRERYAQGQRRFNDYQNEISSVQATLREIQRQFWQRLLVAGMVAALNIILVLSYCWSFKT
jgi:hypothetical protein